MCVPGCPPSLPSLGAMGAAAAVVAGSLSPQTRPIPERERLNFFVTDIPVSWFEIQASVNRSGLSRDSSMEIHLTCRIYLWLDIFFFSPSAVLWFEKFSLTFTGVYFCLTSC